MVRSCRVATVGAVLVAFAVLSAIVPTLLNPTLPNDETRRRDARWVSSSPYWLDRQACRYLGLCGLMHLRRDLPYVLPRPAVVGDGDGGYIRRLELLKRRMWEDESERGAADGQKGRPAKAARLKSKAREHASLKDIPKHVLDHAPLLHLFSREYFWPADISEHLKHVGPFLDDEAMNATARLSSLHKLNSNTGLVSLKSNDDIERRPDWLYSHVGKPVPFREPLSEEDVLERRPQATHEDRARASTSTWFDVGRDVPLHHIAGPQPAPGRRPPAPNGRGQPFDTPPELPSQPPEEPEPPRNATDEGYSAAPAVLILVEKAPGILDAYWFFFYSYNLGQTVAGLRFGNHVGDWEHCMIRFQDGVPLAMFLSEHEDGQSFEFDAMQRYRRWPDRPVIFSAVGSHAMYGLPGKHPYVLPFGLLADETDRGPLWDPAKNTYAYFYDDEADGGDALDSSANAKDVEDGQLAMGREGRASYTSLVPASSNPDAPTSWFHFTGSWGDNLYSLADVRQWRLFMQYHYVTGPTGPKEKQLGREKMCRRLACRLMDHLDPKGRWY